MNPELLEYIEHWNKIDGIKPQNEPKFIELFIDFMQSLDDSGDIDFEGDGSYFGKQIKVYKDRNYSRHYGYGFEIAYCDSIISVYKDNHEGFWTPEYIRVRNVEDNDFHKVKSVIKETMLRLMGLDKI
jgi:hypothetical protein